MYVRAIDKLRNANDDTGFTVFVCGSKGSSCGFTSRMALNLSLPFSLSLSSFYPAKTGTIANCDELGLKIGS